MVGPAAVETHISRLFGVDDRMYKSLKPVQTDFLDLRTVDDREQALRRELELNRRFAPDVYLDVLSVVRHGEVVDHVLEMRRLPDDRRLTALVGATEFDDALRRIAHTVAAAHERSPRTDEAAECAGADAVAGRWTDNLDALARFDWLDADRVSAIGERALGYLSRRRRLFESRIEHGHATELHGDLRAEDIFCLDDGPRLLDCLAFDDRLRQGDVLEDIAFLVMDLTRLAGPDAGRAFVDYYREFTNEGHPGSLAHFYVAYRALVRAKIACIRVAQGDRGARGELDEYLDLCEDQLARARVQLVVVGGEPGTGKSTLSQALGDAMHWVVLRSDELRKDVQLVAHGDHAYETPDAGIYAPEQRNEVYRQLLDQAGRLLGRGESVVLDASWADAEWRHTARAVADQQGSGVIELRCVADPGVTRERIVRRMAAGVDEPSDATVEVADTVAARFESWPEAVEIRTDRTVGDAVREALPLVRSR